MIVVTGATGLVGNVLLHSLAVEGATGLRAVVRRGSNTAVLSDLDVEIAEGDVLDYDSLVRAFHGAEIVYHLAGTVSIASGGYKGLRETNVDGTRNVLAACREAGVGRLVYASSVHAFVRQPHGTCLTETVAVDPDQAHGSYDRTKAEATGLVLQATQEGLDAVLVYPSGIIGPFDYRPSPTGAAIVACGRGRLGAYVHGGYNFVDVRDVAQGLMAAAAKGRSGEGYLLTGDEITVSDLLQTVARLAGTRPPRLRLPLGFVKAVSPLIPAYYWISRERPLFTSYSLDVISSNCWMSHEKAARELGFSPRPIQETLVDTVRWFREEGML
ncbi:MAG: NAD-dependent epimerase/dehydratase family protein [Thermoleophilia bacterium]|nr:NAD-dependent epimerase/dehydratase family protein [Thermoleophilia bacterium]